MVAAVWLFAVVFGQCDVSGSFSDWARKLYVRAVRCRLKCAERLNVALHCEQGKARAEDFVPPLKVRMLSWRRRGPGAVMVHGCLYSLRSIRANETIERLDGDEEVAMEMAIVICWWLQKVRRCFGRIVILSFCGRLGGSKGRVPRVRGVAGESIKVFALEAF